MDFCPKIFFKKFQRQPRGSSSSGCSSSSSHSSCSSNSSINSSSNSSNCCWKETRPLRSQRRLLQQPLLPAIVHAPAEKYHVGRCAVGGWQLPGPRVGLLQRRHDRFAQHQVLLYRFHVFPVPVPNKQTNKPSQTLSVSVRRSRAVEARERGPPPLKERTSGPSTTGNRIEAISPLYQYILWLILLWRSIFLSTILFRNYVLLSKNLGGSENLAAEAAARLCKPGNDDSPDNSFTVNG